ncbi:hypothetical protein [Blastococcus sp. SYSU DS0617]
MTADGPTLARAVVGLHFLPPARVLPGLGLPLLGTGVTAVAGAALLVGALTDVPPTAVTGPGTGLLLLLAAVGSLVALLRGRRTAGEQGRARARGW